MRSDRFGPALGFLKFSVVLVVGLAIGIGGGYGLGKLGEKKEDAPDALVALTPDGRDTKPAKPSVAADGALDVTVDSARYKPATTARGRKRRRARLAVRLTVRNPTILNVSLGSAVITFGKDRVTRDSMAKTAGDELAKPIAPGASAKGELRFETSGAATTRLSKRKTVKLRLNGRSQQVTVKR